MLKGTSLAGFAGLLSSSSPVPSFEFLASICVAVVSEFSACPKQIKGGQSPSRSLLSSTLFAFFASSRTALGC